MKFNTNSLDSFVLEIGKNKFWLNKRIKLRTIYEKLKIERTAYWVWEKGKRVPKESYIRDIAAILEVRYF